jgi:hypothetical protein
MMTRRILLAVDTNTASEPVKVAGDLAELSGADVLVLHCDELDTVSTQGSGSATIRNRGRRSERRSRSSVTGG